MKIRTFILPAAVVATAIGATSALAGGPVLIATPGTPAPQASVPAGGFDTAASAALVRAHYGVMRRARVAGDPPGDGRHATAANGSRIAITYNEHGVCITPSFGGMACGDPALADSHPVILTRVGGASETTDMAGMVPDDVETIQVDGSRQNVAVASRENVFELKIAGVVNAVRWVKRDGTVVDPMLKTP
jgi:hypothetical protein